MKTRIQHLFVAVALCSTLNFHPSSALAQGTAFTYQGRLNDGGNPANGSYDLRFTIQDAASGGIQIAAPLTNSPTSVSNGLFFVTLDFDSGVFPGANRWLEIAVRTNGPGAFVTLAARQQITSTPYAIHAVNAGTATTATTAGNFSGSLSGDVTGTQGATTVASVGGQTAANVASGANAANAATSVNAPNTIVRRDASGSFSAGGIIGANFTGNGGGLTNLPAGSVIGTLPDARLTPNIARLNGTNIFIGTNTFAGVTIAMNGNNLINGAFTGNLNGNATTATSSTTATTANNFSGSLSGNVTGTQGATVVASVGGQSAANVASGASAANAATSANTASTIVKRDASGNFSAGTITGSFVGNGNGLTNVNLLTAIPAGSIVLTTNAGTFGFTIDSAPLTGGNPISVVAADVNGDGKEDLITANYGTNTLTVLTNNGSGRFVLASSPSLGVQPRSVVAADVNGDGKMDLITANASANALLVLTNNGSGGFVLSTLTFVGTSPISVVAADINGDGKVDLISANYDADTLTVLTNNGSGKFELASSPTVGTSPSSVVAADVNSDGIMDLICAIEDDDELEVLLGTGGGNFVAHSFSSTDTNPQSIAAADVNGDGKVDMITANLNGGTLTVLTNNGGGTFGSNATLTAGYQTPSVVAADVNGDGKVDLICSTINILPSPPVVDVFTNNGSGGFALAASPTLGERPEQVIAADVNGDGSMDLITADYYDSTVTVLFNTLSAVTTTATFSGNFTGSALSVNGSLTISGFPIVSQSSFVATNNATLTATTGYVKLSATSPVTLNATTAIANGTTIGAVLILEGSSDVNTVTVPGGANTRLTAAHPLGSADTLTLIWNGLNWVQTAFA